MTRCPWRARLSILPTLTLGLKVWTYLWTKSISAGGLLLGALLVLFTTDRSGLVTIAAPAIAVGFLLITAALLIWDLKQPKRFLFLLDPRKINRRSWLALGGHLPRS